MSLSVFGLNTGALRTQPLKLTNSFQDLVPRQENGFTLVGVFVSNTTGGALGVDLQMTDGSTSYAISTAKSIPLNSDGSVEFPFVFPLTFWLQAKAPSGTGSLVAFASYFVSGGRNA